MTALVISVLALGASWSQANTASDSYQLQRNFELKTRLADAMSDANFASQSGMKLLFALRSPDRLGYEHAYQMGQEFEETAAVGSNSLSSVAFITSQYRFSGSLEAARQRLEVARVATAEVFGSDPSGGAERDELIDEAITRWAEVVEALNEVRSVAYCELVIKGEEPAADNCPIEPTIIPTSPSN